MAKNTLRTGRLVALAIIVIVCIWAGWTYVNGMLGTADSVVEAPAPEPEPAAPEPELPGDPFEASGTLLALPGAPSLPVNVWDNPDRSSGVVHVVGKLSPGQTITITRRYRHPEEDQLYYRIESGELVGWLPETAIDVGQ
jgi:hypothetical protein